MSIQWTVEDVVMQPTTFCNINCTYCYLADRRVARRMSPEVASRLAKWVENHDRPTALVWHAGEPLASGLKHLRSLLLPLEKARINGALTHAIQTNGTLITPEWCELFRQFEVRVGLSVDGPAFANQNRVDWQGKETFNRVKNAAEMLQNEGIIFSAICVVTSATLDKPEELYEFFKELGCDEVGFNIEEKLGVNQKSASDDGLVVRRFWERLFQKWKTNPAIRIREFTGAIEWMRKECAGEKTSALYDLFPTIGWNGDVTVLAPEFLGTTSERYGTFTVGNILQEPLESILQKAVESNYVQDYVEGVLRCRETCNYFNSCRGGVASNKYFEHGWTGATETVYCRNREQRLIDGMLEVL